MDLNTCTGQWITVRDRQLLKTDSYRDQIIYLVCQQNVPQLQLHLYVHICFRVDSYYVYPISCFGNNNTAYNMYEIIGLALQKENVAISIKVLYE